MKSKSPTHTQIRDTPGQEEIGTDRIEAFSDGVFAIAITLLVLNIHVPQPPELKGISLLMALSHQGGNYLSFILSFLIVGVVWAFPLHHR